MLLFKTYHPDEFEVLATFPLNPKEANYVAVSLEHIEKHKSFRTLQTKQDVQIEWDKRKKSQASPCYHGFDMAKSGRRPRYLSGLHLQSVAGLQSCVKRGQVIFEWNDDRKIFVLNRAKKRLVG